MDKDKTTTPRPRKAAAKKAPATKKAPAKAAAPRKSATGTARRKPRVSDSATILTADERLQMIRTAAYFRAERRGFAPGHEAEDWLAAEAEVEAQLAAVTRRPRARKAAKPGID